MTPNMPCKNETPFGCLEHFQRLEERLAAVQAQLESGLAEIRTIYDAQGRRIDRAEKTLFGNGGTGLCTKVSAILWIVSGVAGFVAVLLGQAVAAWVK